MPTNRATRVLKQRIMRLNAMGMPFVYDGVRYSLHDDMVSCCGIASQQIPQELYILDGTQEIQWEAFSNINVSQVHIPDTICIIGAAAFEESALTEIHFGKHSQLRSMGTWAFAWCSKLKQLDLRHCKGTPQQRIAIPDCLCSRCTHLEEVWLPTTAQVIGSGAFEGCHSLKKIHLPRGCMVRQNALPDQTRMVEREYYMV